MEYEGYDLCINSVYFNNIGIECIDRFEYQKVLCEQIYEFRIENEYKLFKA